MKKMSALRKSGVFCCLAMSVLFPAYCCAEEGLCAKVKIENPAGNDAGAAGF
ncbi:MAG: hypothetical protein HC887_10500 [Desulfobacteraceae bacterium]|nr:hypothetical protein [Desulfobacteraceae bacterium]